MFFRAVLIATLQSKSTLQSMTTYFLTTCSVFRGTMYANIPGSEVPFCSGCWYAHCTCFFSYLATSALSLVLREHDLCAYHWKSYWLTI